MPGAVETDYPRWVDAVVNLGIMAGSFQVAGSVFGILAGLAARGLGIRRARFVPDPYGGRWTLEPINLLLWFGWGAAVGAVCGTGVWAIYELGG
jgi:hypothetical protein